MLIISAAAQEKTLHFYRSHGVGEELKAKIALLKESYPDWVKWMDDHMSTNRIPKTDENVLNQFEWWLFQ